MHVLVIVCRSTCKVFRTVLSFPFSQVTCTCNTQHTSQHRTQVTWKTSHYGPLWSETWEDRRWRGRSKVLAHGTLARGCGGSRERESCCWEATWQYRFAQGRKGIEVQEPAGMKKKKHSQKNLNKHQGFLQKKKKTHFRSAIRTKILRSVSAWWLGGELKTCLLGTIAKIRRSPVKRTKFVWEGGGFKSHFRLKLQMVFCIHIGLRVEAWSANFCSFRGEGGGFKWN